MVRLRRSRRFSARNLREGLVFVVPFLVFLIILYGMIVWTFYTSVASWSGTAPNYAFGGLRWYRLMIGLDRFWVGLGNNLKWLLIGVVPTVAIAVLLAYLLEIAPIRGVENYVRSLTLYPVAMSFVVTGTIWSWMFQPDRGVINTLLSRLGLGFLQGTFTANPRTATYWLILIFIWQYLGFSIIILQSSFRTTELREMVESATLDGASRMRILVWIVIPNIRSGLLVLVSLLLISSLKTFDIVYVVTFGGPGYATDVLALFMFIATFQQRLVSLGAGLGVIIFLMAFILVIPYTLYALRRWFD